MSTVGVVASAAGGLHTLCQGLIDPLLELGHQVGVTLTPTARTWLDHLELTAAIEDRTGLPVRTQPRLWGQPSPHPAPDLLIAAPLSATSCAKLALGIGDNQAMTQLCEGISVLPSIVFPRINAAHARHPSWADHLTRLRQTGAHLVVGEELWPLHEPRAAGTERTLPWAHIVDTAVKMLATRERS